ncbi:holo-[acyl-carrier protein] synthase [Virgibacillus halotolerans]|nr:holo-[acyl-carrier protein] synthase [Virgibacillus halotolerans]
MDTTFSDFQKKGRKKMIKGIGIDIIELNRIKKSIEKNNRFANRILTQNETTVFNELPTERRKIEYLAGRFAAKEAFAKATGTGIGALSFQHIEIIAGENGAPVLKAKGYEKDSIFISITHSHDYAVAQVVIEVKEGNA